MKERGEVGGEGSEGERGGGRMRGVEERGEVGG